MKRRRAKWSPAGVAAAGIIVVALALLLAACSSAGESSSTVASATESTSPPTPRPTAAPSSTATSLPPLPPPTGYQATTVVQGLRIPWEIRFVPDGRLLITEREGRIVLADVGSGAVTPVGTVEVRARGEGGLMGLTIDPAFPDEPYIYVSYTYAGAGGTENRVSRLALNGAATATPTLGAETVLVDAIPGGQVHHGSRVAFGPDGFLWVTTGDAGERDSAQAMDSLAGKVLRMTRDGRPAPDNPYGDRPHPYSLIYTSGHRNPQGLAFDPDSGQAYVTEHGPADNDEINRLERGGDYGWPVISGAGNRPGFVDPLFTWTPTIAPAAALFYAGDLLPALAGTFVFVTLKESDLRVLRSFAEEEILFDDEFGKLRAVAQGPDGALYVATSNHDGRGRPRTGDDRIIRIGPGSS